VDGIESKSVWFVLPAFTDEFVGGQAAEDLESSGEVVGSEEVVQVRFELVIGVVEVSLDGSVLDGPIHAFDLPVCPWMVGLGEPVFDSMNEAELACPLIFDGMFYISAQSAQNFWPIQPKGTPTSTVAQRRADQPCAKALQAVVVFQAAESNWRPRLRPLLHFDYGDGSNCFS
jgi:hypothetical protein